MRYILHLNNFDLLLNPYPLPLGDPPGDPVDPDDPRLRL